MAERPSRIGDRRTRFDRFAEAISRFVSEAAFFTISAILVAIWIPTIALFHSIDTWQLVLSTITSVLAFLLIALLQNSERRYDRALHTRSLGGGRSVGGHLLMALHPSEGCDVLGGGVCR